MEGATEPDEAVIVEFSEATGSTRVDYRHPGVPDDAGSAAAHERGDAGALDRLEAMLSGD